MLKPLLKFFLFILVLTIGTTITFAVLEYFGVIIPLMAKFTPYLIIAVIIIFGNNKLLFGDKQNALWLVALYRLMTYVSVAFIVYSASVLINLLSSGELIGSLLTIICALMLNDLINFFRKKSR